MLAPRTLLNEPMARVALRGALLRPWRRRRFHSFGERSVIDRPLAIYGPWQIAVGDRVLVLRGAWLSVERSAWERPAPVLRIGDGVGLRPFCTISAAESVVIEDNVVLSAFSSVIDSDHVQVPGVENVLWSPLRTGPIRIGRGTWIGERCAVLRGVDIGCHCVIGANSVVTEDIPDYSVAVGTPARVVRTMDRAEWSAATPGAGAAPPS